MEVQLIYNVVLDSVVQQYDSVCVCVCVCVCIYIFFSSMVYYRILNIVLGTIQQNLAVYLFYIQQFVSANPKLLIYPSPTPSPLVTVSLFSMSVSLFLFCRYVHLCYVLDSIYKWLCMVFNFLFLTCFTQCNNLQVHPWCSKLHPFILFYA